MLLQPGEHRPVADVGALFGIGVYPGLLEAVVDAPPVGAFIKAVGIGVVCNIQLGGGGQAAAAAHGGGNAPGVHKGYPAQLPLADLGALPAVVISCHMADGQGVVGGHVQGAEAGPADTGPEGNAPTDEPGGDAVSDQLQNNGLAGGIDAKVRPIRPRRISLQDIRGGRNVFKGPAHAAGNGCLLDSEPPLLYLVTEGVGQSAAASGVLLHLGQHFHQKPGIFIQFPDGIHITGVEG